MLQRLSTIFVIQRLNLCKRIVAINYHFNIKSFSNKTENNNNSNSSVSKHVRSSVPSSSFGQKAKKATETTYYTAIIVAGIGALGLMIYAVFGELLSSFSPQAVYSAAVDRVVSDPKVTDLFGGGIKCYGESSRRGRRQHINHMFYELDGQKGIRIKFYLKGQYRSGAVHLDARQNITGGGWQFRYLFAQSDSYPHNVIIVEDNRSQVDKEQNPLSS